MKNIKEKKYMQCNLDDKHSKMHKKEKMNKCEIR